MISSEHSEVVWIHGEDGVAEDSTKENAERGQTVPEGERYELMGILIESKEIDPRMIGSKLRIELK